ncbi:hypothetical protein ALC53_10455 [Atta colombica]|uniref:Uncharacterized protein n=1 Tax=Atta colombica TaxID=520822 RepID=A0A151I171_9HYME|nr:hypothetical protein ALC53_10455 [Atta colombica]
MIPNFHYIVIGISFLSFVKNERSIPMLQSGSRILVEGRNTDEQLLFHLFDTLFKCFICLDLEIPQDKRLAFPAFLLLSRDLHKSFLNVFSSQFNSIPSIFKRQNHHQITVDIEYCKEYSPHRIHHGVGYKISHVAFLIVTIVLKLSFFDGLIQKNRISVPINNFPLVIEPHSRGIKTTVKKRMRMTTDDYIDQRTLRSHDPVHIQSTSFGFVVDCFYFIQKLQFLRIR